MTNEEISIKVRGLNSAGLKNLGNVLGKELAETETSEVFGSMVDSMSSNGLNKAIKDLPDTKKKEINKSSTFPPPTEKTRDRLWSIVVWSFSIVMVGAFFSIAVGALFLEKPESPIISGDVLLSIFTASVGFFAGLFAPSPGEKS